MKALTVRLRDDDLARELEFVARIDGSPLSEVIQASIKMYVRARLRDPVFTARAAALVQADQSRIAPAARKESP